MCIEYKRSVFHLSAANWENKNRVWASWKKEKSPSSIEQHGIHLQCGIVCLAFFPQRLLYELNDFPYARQQIALPCSSLCRSGHHMQWLVVVAGLLPPHFAVCLAMTCTSCAYWRKITDNLLHEINEVFGFDLAHFTPFDVWVFYFSPSHDFSPSR